MSDRVLRATLKREWFVAVSNGDKMEEYREIKPFWKKRLEGRIYESVEFRNGYAKNSPTITVEVIGIFKRQQSAHPSWGEPAGDHYVISLGRILSRRNT